MKTEQEIKQRIMVLKEAKKNQSYNQSYINIVKINAGILALEWVLKQEVD